VETLVSEKLGGKFVLGEEVHRANSLGEKCSGAESLCVKTIAVEVESKPAPFEKRKGCGTQSLHPTDVSVSEKIIVFSCRFRSAPFVARLGEVAGHSSPPGCLTPDLNF